MKDPRSLDMRMTALNHAIESERNIGVGSRLDAAKVVESAKKYYAFLKGEEE